MARIFLRPRSCCPMAAGWGWFSSQNSSLLCSSALSRACRTTGSVAAGALPAELLPSLEALGQGQGW